MENVELDSTWHRDAPAYTDLLPVTPAANISSSDTTSAVMVTEKPHFLQEFGEDIVQFARGESSLSFQYTCKYNNGLKYIVAPYKK